MSIANNPRAVFTALVFCTSTISYSQSNSQSDSQSENRPERIEVTGTLIKRIQIEGPSPTVTIDQEAIENSGFNETSQLLGRLTLSPFGSSSSSTQGATGVSLRGLGSARTLILLNGQRLPASGDSFTPGFTNTNVVPLTAIERIEIVPDGSSALYGSDAVAGVINIITKKNFNGHAFSNKTDVPNQPGGITNLTTYTYGLTTAKHSLLLSGQINVNSQARTSDRNYLRESGQDNFRFSNNYTDDADNTRPAPGCPRLNSDGRCAENLTNQSLTLPSARSSIFLSHNYKINSNHEFFHSIVFRENQTRSQSASDNVINQAFTGAQAPASWGSVLPGYTAGNDINIWHRVDALGPKRSDTTLQSRAYIAGFKGYLFGSDWDYKLTNNYHQFTENYLRQNYVRRANFVDAVVSGRYDPYGSAKDVTGLASDPLSVSQFTINTTEFISTGEVFTNERMSVSVAAGLFSQSLAYKATPDPDAVNRVFYTLGGTAGEGSRTLLAAFSEVGATIDEKLELQLAVRHDEYSDFGGTTNPKLAFSYKPTSTVLLRSSVGTAFQAPTLQETYGPKLVGFVGTVDFKRCQEANNDTSNPACQNTSYPAEQGANPDLKEETSFAYNVGVMYQPNDQWSVGADYWRTRITNVVSSDIRGLLEAEALGANPADYGAEVRRDPSTDEITFISAFLRNFASEDTVVWISSLIRIYRHHYQVS